MNPFFLAYSAVDDTFCGRLIYYVSDNFMSSSSFLSSVGVPLP